jgi:adenine-specific DNA-methyltransferase
VPRNAAPRRVAKIQRTLRLGLRQCGNRPAQRTAAPQNTAPEANALINSLRVCDPAVGSGHFLVSALNELIAIKSDLGILCDSAGKLLPLNAVVGNDELILTDPSTDQPVEYRPGNTASQRIQETLFNEKQTLIENCLFGVDINPKSVMICRLRLWIELLKHAYFTAESKYQRLETCQILTSTSNPATRW